LKEIRELFLKLVGVGSPSGFEEPMMITLMSELEPLVDKVYETSRGNVIGFRKGSNPDAPSIAIVAHMDQVGFVVSNIDERGFIRFRKLGWPATRAIQGQQMRLLTEKGPVVGVVGVKPVHIMKPEERSTIPPIEDMYIDIGAWSMDEVEKIGVTIGTPIVYNCQPILLANNLISSPGIDDKGGCTALIATAKMLKDIQIPASVYYIGSVEEEPGLRGAQVVLHDLKIDMAVAIDTVPAGWQPDVMMRDLFYEIGRGPGIHIGNIIRDTTIIQHHKVRKWLVDTAKQEGIPFQMGLMHGATDSLAFMQTRTGIPSATIGLPRRYAHSPVEVFDLNDLINLVELLIAALKRLDASFNLHRI
jgi:endoglucanase